MKPSEKLLTPRIIADRMNTHENTVRRWMREGVMPSVKIGRRLYLPESVFDELIENKLKEVI